MEYRFSNTLKVERAKLDMTQASLSKEVNICVSTISAIENGDSPSLVNAFKIAHFFGCIVSDIFKFEEINI